MPFPLGDASASNRTDRKPPTAAIAGAARLHRRTSGPDPNTRTKNKPCCPRASATPAPSIGAGARHHAAITGRIHRNTPIARVTRSGLAPPEAAEAAVAASIQCVRRSAQLTGTPQTDAARSVTSVSLLFLCVEKAVLPPPRSAPVTRTPETRSDRSGSFPGQRHVIHATRHQRTHLLQAGPGDIGWGYGVGSRQ